MFKVRVLSSVFFIFGKYISYFRVAKYKEYLNTLNYLNKDKEYLIKRELRKTKPLTVRTTMYNYRQVIIDKHLFVYSFNPQKTIKRSFKLLKNIFFNNNAISSFCMFNVTFVKLLTLFFWPLTELGSLLMVYKSFTFLPQYLMPYFK